MMKYLVYVPFTGETGLQVGGLFFAKQAGQYAGSLVLAAAHRHIVLVFALAGTLAGPLSTAAGRHRQRGRPVRHRRRRLFEHVHVRINCRPGGNRKRKKKNYYYLRPRRVEHFFFSSIFSKKTRHRVVPGCKPEFDRR